VKREAGAKNVTDARASPAALLSNCFQQSLNLTTSPPQSSLSINHSSSHIANMKSGAVLTTALVAGSANAGVHRVSEKTIRDKLLPGYGKSLTINRCR
jgi:hypothetical protein